MGTGSIVSKRMTSENVPLFSPLILGISCFSKQKACFCPNFAIALIRKNIE